MCGYVAESVDGGSVPHPALMDQLNAVLAHEEANAPEPCPLIKIYTSGSFLDEREVGAESRQAIADAFADRERIVVESLPDFVEPEKLSDFIDVGLATDVAIGLETANDRIRRDCVNKYFSYDAFIAATDAAAQVGAGVKAYLLLKPPFLTEGEATRDMIDSIQACAEHAHTISMNPTNVQRYTMVDELYYHGGYRPPWLWSICEILATTAETDAIVVSDPVGAGQDRGAHNCGECDERVSNAIKDFSIRQEPTVFEEVSCACEETWDLVMGEETSYNLPLA